jgi:hypothetical protein
MRSAERQAGRDSNSAIRGLRCRPPLRGGARPPAIQRPSLRDCKERERWLEPSRARGARGTAGLASSGTWRHCWASQQWHLAIRRLNRG